jgi:predicted SprT family Zn-dependent metalloprotease
MRGPEQEEIDRMTKTAEAAVRQTPPTAASFTALQKAFDFFNKELFDGKLPPAMILLHRHKKARGYFGPARFGDKTEKVTIDEIALNPTVMRDRTDRETLSTLVHEMVHMQQQHFGTPPKGGYHNKEWATMMKAVGLFPSTTGEPGGAETGPKCSHYIVEGDRFDVACAKLLKTGLTLPYSERRFSKAEKKRAAQKTKIKYVCPDCEAKVWGKADMNIICGDCREQMEEV